jgi:hypothetical protein
MIPIFSRVTEWILILVGSALMLLSQPIQAAKLADWKAEYNPGAGLSLASPDGDFRFRQLGYLQVRGDLRHPDFQRSSQGEFSVRRARLDWIIDINEKYQLLLETDGADFNGPNKSDFDLVVAKISGPTLWGGRWTAGKFITPFSTENNRSSRSLDMIERYTALNSLFLLPALDVQFGGMIEQPLAEDWTLYGGVFNGNGRAADNLSDDNDDKEFQLKVRNEWSDQFQWSVSYDRSNEEDQELFLRGYTFTSFSSVPVDGTRRIYGASFDYTSSPYSFRGEGLYADFADASAELTGGYLQPGYFLEGDRDDGLQALLRLDYATVDGPGLNSSEGDAIGTVTGGLNWYVNPNVRLKGNLVAEYYDNPGNDVDPTSGVQGDGWKPYFLTELQFKF